MKIPRHAPHIVNSAVLATLVFAALTTQVHSAERVVATASAGDRAFYFGGIARESVKTVFELSDGTLLLAGSAQDLDWLGPNVPRTTLGGSGAIRNANGGGLIGFLLHVSADLGTPLRVVSLPLGAAQDISVVRSTNVPGEPTGTLYISGTTKDSRSNGGGYFLGRLNGNFVDAVPDGFIWVNNIYATGDHQTIQPWDVDAGGRAVYASGQPFGTEWASLHRLKADGTPDLVENWRYHVGKRKSDGTRIEGAWTPASSRSDVDVLSSQIVLKTLNRCDLRSWTSADYNAIVPDENGGTKRGRWPLDLFYNGPCDPSNASATQSGPGYTGYRLGSNPTHRVGTVAIDRRSGHIYLGFSTQSRLPGGNPDFEPTVIAFDSSGSKQWWARLYKEASSNSSPDQYVDGLAIDYSKPAASGSLAVLARSHGNNTINLWSGNSIPSARVSDNPGYGFANQFTGTNGNIHVSWVGKLKLADGTLQYASWLTSYLRSDPLGQAAYGDPNLDGWASHNAGWANLNTTRCRSDVKTDLSGRVYVICSGQRSVTTRNAFQKMPKPNQGSYPGWADFVRVYSPRLETLAFSSLLTGAWDSSGNGAGNIALTGVVPVNGGVVVVGRQSVDSNGVAQGNPIPLSDVPSWGYSTPASESGVIARFAF